MAFPECLLAEIRKEFGEHCLRHRDYRKANEFFESSLQLNPKELNSVYHLANTHARIANLDTAVQLLDEKSNLESYKNNFNCNLQGCDCSYEKNWFEKNLLLISDIFQRHDAVEADVHHTTKKHRNVQKEAKKKGPKLGKLGQRFETTQTNFQDMIGKNAGNCLYEQRKYFDKIMHSWKPSSFQSNPSEQIPLTDDCDVVSVLEENVQKKSVKERYRVKQLKRIFAQVYMQSAWVDFEFINELKANEVLVKSTQNPESFDIISREIDDCVDGAAVFISQLHARCPLYTYNHKMFPDSDHKKKTKRVSKFRLQYQTRREMFTALEEIHECRARGKLKKLIKIAEHELGIHYKIKSEKLMPRRKEFSIEICNLVGLAHLDRLKLPQNREQLSDLEILAAVFEVSIHDRNAIVPYTFGDQSTYRDPAEPDTSFLVFKEKINRLNDRLQSSTLPIERCHLYHEMGKENLTQIAYDESRSCGRKIIDEAKNARSYLWKFLGQILICRADVMQKNFIKINDSLEAAVTMVDVFQNSELSNVISSCVECSKNLV